MERKYDYKILSFLNKFKVATTLQLNDIFFRNVSNVRCRQVLYRLYKEKKVKRFRNSLNEPYKYYIPRKPKHVEHQLWLVELYRQLLKNNYKVRKIKVDENIYYWNEFLRPDAEMVINNRKWFVEIARKKKVDLNKYLDYWYYCKHKGKDYPRVIVVTKKKIPSITKIKYVEISPDEWDLRGVIF